MHDSRFVRARALPVFFAGACGLLTAAPAGAQLTIRLTSAPGDSAPIYVAGSFNGWNPAAPGYRLDRRGGAYSLTLPDLSRGPIEFKFTRGSC